MIAKATSYEMSTTVSIIINNSLTQTKRKQPDQQPSQDGDSTTLGRMRSHAAANFLTLLHSPLQDPG